MRLVIVEDDAELRDALSALLRQAGYEVDAFSDGRPALDALLASEYDLAIVDLMLPGMSGIALVRDLRRQHRGLPILIVTARDSLEDRVGGLDAGADDYLVKPFDLPELEARVRALLRRAKPALAARIVAGRLTVDSAARRARIDGRPVELTVREWALLELFLSRPGHALSKQTIANSIDDSASAIAPNTIEVYVSRLRAKLEPAGIVIRTVRGFGYLWEQSEHAQ